MTPEAALLRAVLANPDDDLPRLVYADWLEEHGRPGRAELIRVQCEAARLQRAGERSRHLVRRAARLLKAKGVIQVADLWPLLDDQDRYEFRRGFVERVSVTLADFFRLAPSLFARHPVTAVTLTDREPWISPCRVAWLEDAPNHQTPPKYCLPPELMGHLARDPRTWDDGSEFRYNRFKGGFLLFHADADAQAALSDACVAYGRELAGLPPLRVPATSR